MLSYVADWTEPVNNHGSIYGRLDGTDSGGACRDHGSRDWTAGLGLEAVEPTGWAHRFCKVQDTMLGDGVDPVIQTSRDGSVLDSTGRVRSLLLQLAELDRRQ